MKYLKNEINLNKKFIATLVLVNLLAIGLCYSYAWFQISVIQNNVVVLASGNLDIVTLIKGQADSTFSLNAGETKTIEVVLTNTSSSGLGYKMFYDVEGSSIFHATSTESFSNNLVEGEMEGTKTINLTFQNKGEEDLTFNLIGLGGIKGQTISGNGYEELILNIDVETSKPLYDELVQLATTRASIVSYDSNTSAYYISGAKDDYNQATTTDVDCNYVWYSGKLWRIVAVYTDGTIKLVSEDIITTMLFGSSYTFLNSWTYQFLNEDFLDTLYNYQNIIKTDASWDVSAQTTQPPKVPAGTTIVSSKVGLLNDYEYYQSYSKATAATGYLNLGYRWYLSHTYGNYLRSVTDTGALNLVELDDHEGIRPSIILKSGIKFTDGDGSYTNPFILAGDKKSSTGSLNERLSGEYVNFDGILYRIVNVTNNITKLVMVDYLKDSSGNNITKSISETTLYGDGTTDTYWQYYLNEVWYPTITANYRNMMVDGTYYLNRVPANTSYKAAVCSTVSDTVTTKDCDRTSSTTWTGKVGLLQVGDMFSSQLVSSSSAARFFLMNPYSSSSVRVIIETNKLYYQYGTQYYPLATRPTITLSSNTRITSGNGTIQSPYEISL